MRRSSCPITCTLDLIGDKWTLVILRDILFFEKTRFEEFLDSPEKISTNILTDRLNRLETEGLLTKAPYSNHKNRMAYKATARGESLVPVIKAIVKWGLANIEDTATLRTPSESGA